MKTHQIIICSYSKDFQWLIHCLTSLKKFSRGFIPPVICVDSKDFLPACQLVNDTFHEASVVVKDGRPTQGFMRAQLAMMTADLLCPEADVIHFLGSDCLALHEFGPEMYCAPDGRPAVLYSSYLFMGLVHPDTIPWRKGVERVIGVYPENEYMRRLPSIFPREIFAPMREHVEKLHGKKFEEYIYDADAEQRDTGKTRDTSEANILGAFAHRFMPETCAWIDIATAGMYGTQVVGWPSAIGQFWSHGGLDLPADACFEYEIDGRKRNSHRKAPRAVINEVLYGAPEQAPMPAIIPAPAL